METIYTTYGYRIEEKTGKTFYSYSETENGICYKDENAWDTGKGICYIPEYDFLDDTDTNFEEKEYSTDLGYTRETLIEEVYEHLKYYYDCKDMHLITNIAEYIFQELDWQSVGTLLEDTDFTEDIKEYYRR